MAPIKFENNIKETLEKRTLQPSENSWVQLSKRLDENENSKSTRPYWWIGIAASIVLLVSVGLLVMDNGNEQNSLPVIVETNENNTIEDVKTELENINPDQQKIIQDKEESNSAVATNSEIIIEEVKAVEKKKAKELIVTKKSSQNNPFNYESKANVVVQNENLEPQTILTIENAKIEEVVAEIQNRQNEASGVSDREIDSLLKAAQRELINIKIYNETTRTVDADVLLRDVEADLERSFRDKVFNALQNGYESVKSAVVERNQK